MKSVQLISSAKKAASSGKLEDAERMLRQVVVSDPGNVQAWYTLACVLMDMRRPQHAAEVFGQTLRLKSDHADALVGMARAQAMMGRLPQALAAAKQATAAAPSNPSAWIELTRRHRVMSHTHEALNAAQRAEALAPKNADALTQLSLCLQDLGRNMDAVEAGRRALARHRGLAELITAATALLATGEAEEAMKLYEEAGRMSPGLTEAIAGRARAAEALGDKKLAISLLEPIVGAANANNAALAQYGTLSAGSPERRGRAIDLIRSRLSIPNNNPANTIALWFALGSLLEAEEDYAGAFDAYRRGKAHYPPSFSAEFTRRRIGELIETFSAEAMARFPVSDSSDPRPVFIVGMPRSGTTLLEQIIAGHPRAQGVGELEDMLRLVNGVPGRLNVQGSYPPAFSHVTKEALGQMAAEYGDRLTQLAPGRDRVVDKMPHNFMALGAISLMFPRATLIHSVRHPLDTCLSCFTTALGPAHAYAATQHGLVVKYTEYRRLMEHWKGVLGDRLVQMRYETLVAEPEPESRRLIAATGLEWDPACLRFYEGKRAVTTASVSQVRRPMYDSSVARWKRFEPYIGELIEGLREFL
ncbi:MAG: sulfotransferase [Phycisphaerales bacterium]|jgi:tetratricopeptide (TPR) repeat protein|nr:sulfotransferase [Phycisphaerales bacterium]